MTLLNVSTRKVNAMCFCSTSARPLIRSHTPDSIISYSTMVLMDLSLLWVKSFLSCRSQYVQSQKVKTVYQLKFFLVQLPQGKVLAPLLILLYINDLPACVNNKVKLYVDDVLLYSFIESESDCVALQEDLDKLIEWADMWLMDFNTKKCEHLRISYQ